MAAASVPSATHTDDARLPEDEEAMQMRLGGLSSWCSVKQIKDLIRSLGLEGMHKVKKDGAKTHAFIYFKSSEARQAAEARLQGYRWKGQDLECRACEALDPKRFVKRPQEELAGSSSGDAKRPRVDGGGAAEATVEAEAEAAPAVERSAADVVAPLHGLPYEQQLARKRASVLSALRKLPKQMMQAVKTLPHGHEGHGQMLRMRWLAPEELKQREWSPCPLEAVVPSPRVDGYRNKCEFSIGRDGAGQPCVGFVLGRFKQGVVAIGPPHGCPNVSAHMKGLAAAVQRAVAASALPPFDKVSSEGFWRQLNVRQAFNPAEAQAAAGGEVAAEGAAEGAAEAAAEGAAEGAATGGASVPQLLAVLVVQSAGLPAEQVAAELEALRAALAASPPRPAVRLRLGVQVCDGPGEAVATEEDLTVLVGGEAGEDGSGPACLRLEETLLGLTFDVSPASFFQVNTAAAERLCTLLRSQCGLTRASVLLDVCCGAGMIGLTMAPAVRHVWGVEMCAPAVVDARRNAARNGVANASFVTGRAEDKIESVLRALSAEDKEHLVAVVDPPRAGLHDSVLKTLRACAELKRMLYVSCHAPSFVKNAVMLCKPPTNAVKGVPFQPVRAFPLDLFPHTEHCELIVLLERADPWPPPPPPTAPPPTAPPPAEAVAAPLAEEAAGGSAARLADDGALGASEQ